MKPRLAVFGATGAVGNLVCHLLDERNFPMESIRFFGSPQSSADRSVMFQGKQFPVEPLIKDRIHDIDLAIASTPDEVAGQSAPWVIRQNGVFVDESAYHRMQPDVPLVVPEVNPQAIADHKGVIASPNCSTTQLVLCLKPIHDRFQIRRVVVSTYQSASGAGQQAQQELLQSTQATLNGDEFQNKQFEQSLAFNLWPKIGGVDPSGQTSEEVKMQCETRKILDAPALAMAVTCVRVPVVNCHSETVFVETASPISATEARDVLKAFPGISILDQPNQSLLPSPNQCSGLDEVFIGRIRRDPSVENGISFWCVSDNLRKGAATNAIQIAELIVQQGLLPQQTSLNKF